MLRSAHAIILACLLGFTPSALADWCLDCIAIAADKAVYRPGEEALLNLDVDAARIDASVADAYVAAVQPDKRAHILRHVPAWELRDLNGQRLSVDPSANGVAGEYRLYFVLAEPGADPLDNRRWLSAASADITVLPQGWTPPTQPPVLRNGAGLPRVISHGGGEILGLQVSNSLQALEQSYAAGQRYFELDFSWTADRHLVLIHDWEQSLRRFFASGEGALTKREFDALPMHFGLNQLNVEQLVDWLEAHPDARVITDIKEDNLSGLYYIAARAGGVLQRIVPQVHGPGEYDRARALGFDRLILTLYQGALDDRRVLDFVRDREVLAVTLPVQRALDGETAALLAAEGVFVYAHSVNAPVLLGLLRERGVSGVYSDRLLPAP